jgi:hypothetical protein
MGILSLAEMLVCTCISCSSYKYMYVITIDLSKLYKCVDFVLMVNLIVVF